MRAYIAHAFYMIGFEVMVVLAVAIVCGAIAAMARGGGGNGFSWGFWLGPLGIIIAAILRASDTIRTERPSAYAAPARPAGGQRLVVRRRGANARPAAPPPPSAVACPHCAGAVEPPASPGAYACPHCRAAIEFE